MNIGISSEMHLSLGGMQLSVKSQNDIKRPDDLQKRKEGSIEC